MTGTQLDSILREVQRRANMLCADGEVDAALDYLDKYHAAMLHEYTEYSMAARSKARRILTAWKQQIILQSTGLGDDLRE